MKQSRCCLWLVGVLFLLVPVSAGAGKNPLDDFIKCENAALAGDADAQFKLAEYYHFGIYLVQDHAREAEFYEKAALQGHIKAQAALAHCYEQGIGVERNPQRAVFWWSKAAEQGDADSQYFLGMALYRGIGTALDYEQALKWLTQSARNGSAFGRGGLGRLYTEGLAVQKDDIQAVAWLSLVSDWQSYKPLLGELEARMSANDIASARALSGKLLKDHGETKK